MSGDPNAPLDDSGFALVRRGYEQGQVDAHMRRLDAEIKILATDRAAAISQTAMLSKELEAARARTERLRTQLQHLSTQPLNVQHMSERMRAMLRLAEDEAADMTASAEAQAEKRVREAEVEAKRLTEAAHAEAESVRATAQAEADGAADHYHRARSEVDEERRTLTADRGRLESEFTARHQAATQEIDSSRAALVADQESHRAGIAARHDESAAAIAAAAAAAEQERTSAWAESEQRRTTVEEDFAIAMDQRRAEAIAALGTQLDDARREAAGAQASASAEADRIVADARVKANQIVQNAERRFDDLRSLRHRVVAQLVAARGELDQAAERFGPLPEETGGGVEHPGSESSVESTTQADEGSAELRPSPTRRDRQPHAVPH